MTLSKKDRGNLKATPAMVGTLHYMGGTPCGVTIREMYVMYVVQGIHANPENSGMSLVDVAEMAFEQANVLLEEGRKHETM